MPCQMRSVNKEIGGGESDKTKKKDGEEDRGRDEEKGIR